MADINLHYSMIPNMGDLLNPIIFKKVFNKEATYQHPDVADIIGIGSILQQVYYPSLFRLANKKPLHVWGSGFIEESFVAQEAFNTMKPLRPLNVLALRGKLTKSYLEKSLGTKIDCILGDPGLLASRVIDEMPKKQYSLGIIPHFIENDADIWDKIYEKYPGSIMINIQDDPIDVIKTIASCEVIISSALHGLIAADAFGIPNAWVYYSDKVIGQGFKFRDYYSSYDLSAKPFVLTNGDIPDIQNIVEEYEVPRMSVSKKQDEMIECIYKFWL